MAHSLEARVPFLDYRLVELLFSLGAGELIERGRTKAVLRRALGDLLPPVVRDRVDKLGFVTPEAAWLRNGLGELAADVFASREFRERGFVDADAARRSLERHRAGERTRRLRALARALRRALGARVPLGSSAVTTQEQVREWWNRNPMSYDVDDPIPYDEDSQEYFREIDRRIFHPRYMRLTADESGKPFSLFVDFDALGGQGRARRRVRQRDRDADARGGRRERDRRRPHRLGRRDDARRLAAFGLEADVRQADAEQLPFADATLRPRLLVGRDPPLERHGPRAPRARARDASRRQIVLMVYHRRSLFFLVYRGFQRFLPLARRLGLHFEGARAGETQGLIARHFTVDELRGKLVARRADERLDPAVRPGRRAAPAPAAGPTADHRAYPAVVKDPILRRFGHQLGAAASRGRPERRTYAVPARVSSSSYMLDRPRRPRRPSHTTSVCSGS